MRFFLVILISWASMANAKALVDCVPKGGQLLENNSLHITYSLEQHPKEPYFLRLRKGFHSLGEEAYIEKIMVKAGFNWAANDKNFSLNYATPEGFFEVEGAVPLTPSAINPKQKIAQATISVNFKPSLSPVGSLMNSIESINGWSCTIEIDEISQLRRLPQAP